MTVHSLAEALHKFVWEVLELDTSEYMNWMRYFNMKGADDQQENLLDMDEDAMIGKLTGE